MVKTRNTPSFPCCLAVMRNTASSCLPSPHPEYIHSSPTAAAIPAEMGILGEGVPTHVLVMLAETAG